MALKFLQRLLGEPWLAFNRFLTVRMLRRKTQQRGAVQTPYEPIQGRMLYVAASALPYHISGYTTRTHAIAQALQAAGGDVCVLTRPGYPWDRKDRLADASEQTTVVDQVQYVHVQRPANNRPVMQFAIEAAASIVQEAIKQRVAVIHAASNHVNALPALIAARQLGIPFQYEMRGLWELSRASRIPEFRDSQGFKQGLELEGLVASQADRLFVISEQLGQYAREHWNVDPARMGLMPNCVDPSRFTPGAVQDVQPNTIVYAGSLIVYEGPEVLAQDGALAREEASQRRSWADFVVHALPAGTHS